MRVKRWEREKLSLLERREHQLSLNFQNYLYSLRYYVSFTVFSFSSLPALASPCRLLDNISGKLTEIISLKFWKLKHISFNLKLKRRTSTKGLVIFGCCKWNCCRSQKAILLLFICAIIPIFFIAMKNDEDSFHVCFFFGWFYLGGLWVFVGLPTSF